VEERARTKKARRLRTVARGYEALKNGKAKVYQAAAKALDDAETRSQRPASDTSPNRSK